MPHGRESFTLIELLIVIAIVAVLSVVVILTLSPVELLKQSRDSNRLSDMDTLNRALTLVGADAPSLSFGAASTTYLSLVDPTATSTTGTNCAGVGITAPTTWAYHCAASSTMNKVDGTGWIPVNFTALSYGSPIGALPKDPTNSTSSGFYYTYTPNFTNWELTGLMESQKYLALEGKDGGTDPALYEKGSNLSIATFAHGLVGYWNFEEGTGGTVTDTSGSGNTTSWSGSGSHWGAGRVGRYSGLFDGTDDSVYKSGAINMDMTSAVSESAWVNTNGTYPATYGSVIWGVHDSTFNISGGNMYFRLSIAGSQQTVGNSFQLATSTWYHVAGTWDGTTMKLYINGVLTNSGGPYPGTLSFTTGNLALGQASYSGAYWFNGMIDDARVYNRALTATEVAAIYNATK